MEIPKHLQYAIEHEESCIKMREWQIEGYKEKIKLLKSRVDYEEVNKKIKPRIANTAGINFSFSKYNELKKEDKQSASSKPDN